MFPEMVNFSLFSQHPRFIAGEDAVTRIRPGTDEFILIRPTPRRIGLGRNHIRVKLPEPRDYRPV